MSDIKILAIETSCDETAAAVIEEVGGRPVVLSNVISSQVDLHAITGGVVPEVASRAHMEKIIPVIQESLENAHYPLPITHSNGQMNKDQLMKNEKREMKNCQHLLAGITHLAVTSGPGLIGSLLVGFNTAKALAYGLDLPIIPINHIEGHIYSAMGGKLINNQDTITRKNTITNTQKSINNLDIDNCDLDINCKLEIGTWKFPLISLTVSGGHTSLTLMKDHGVYETIGETLDDAVGEAYDKVAKLLNLGYPGGPVVSKFANEFRNKLSIFNFQFPKNSQQSNNQFENKKINGEMSKMENEKLQSPIVLPRPLLHDGTFNFSFSGLKTAVLYAVKKILSENSWESTDEIPENIKENICFEFEEAVADVLSSKLKKAIEKYSPKAVVFAGGVSANGYLKERLRGVVSGIDPEDNIKFLTPGKNMSGDNAAMIGLAAYYHIKRGDVKKWDQIHVDSGAELTS